METLIEFKCPHCGGKLEFDAGTQNMTCPYCDSEVDVAALIGNDSVLEHEPVADPVPDRTPDSWEDAGDDGMRSYVCHSCGGEIVADETTGATHCPYCGNPVVMAGHFSGSIKPDCIIPFTVTKEQAKDALKNHCKGKKFLPKLFYTNNHLDEIKGVYVPFWLFDAVASGDAQYVMRNIRHWSDTNYRYTETTIYDGFRSGSARFQNVPVDGATKMPDAMMESIEPFDASKAVPFQTAYLSGYMADKYDVDAAESLPRAKERMKASMDAQFRATVSGYDSVEAAEHYVDVQSYDPKYALYPVWLLSTSFEGGRHLFAVNGQTGKIVGNLPIDKKLVQKYRWIYTGALTAILYVIAFIIARMGGFIG